MLAFVQSAELPLADTRARIRVLVAAKSPISLGGICLLLGTQKDIELVGTADNGSDLLEKAAILKPDLVIAEAGLPRINGFKCASRLRLMIPDARIVLFTEPGARVSPGMCQQAGIDACVSRDRFPEGLLSEIRGIFSAKRAS